MEQTRLKLASIAFVLNLLIFIFAIYSESDLTATGAGLSMLNVPIITYILGETKRSSNNDNKD